MREILFRGKNVVDGKWVYGDLSNYNEDNVCLIYDESCLDYTVYPDSIGQYTGLVDVSGRKIFEGDIMKTAVSGLVQHTGVVEFLDGAFGIRCTDENGYFLCFIAGSYTIIGNIFENSELMEI